MFCKWCKLSLILFHRYMPSDSMGLTFGLSHSEPTVKCRPRSVSFEKRTTVAQYDYVWLIIYEKGHCFLCSSSWLACTSDMCIVESPVKTNLMSKLLPNNSALSSWKKLWHKIDGQTDPLVMCGDKKWVFFPKILKDSKCKKKTKQLNIFLKTKWYQHHFTIHLDH